MLKPVERPKIVATTKPPAVSALEHPAQEEETTYADMIVEYLQREAGVDLSQRFEVRQPPRTRLFPPSAREIG